MNSFSSSLIRFLPFPSPVYILLPFTVDHLTTNTISFFSFRFATTSFGSLLLLVTVVSVLPLQSLCLGVAADAGAVAVAPPFLSQPHRSTPTRGLPTTSSACRRPETAWFSSVNRKPLLWWNSAATIIFDILVFAAAWVGIDGYCCLWSVRWRPAPFLLRSVFNSCRCNLSLLISG